MFYIVISSFRWFMVVLFFQSSDIHTVDLDMQKFNLFNRWVTLMVTNAYQYKQVFLQFFHVLLFFTGVFYHHLWERSY